MAVAGRILVALGLLLMAQQSLQLSTRHPLYSTIQRINENAAFSFIAIFGTSENNEKAFFESGYFVPSPYRPTLALAGRTIHIGSIGTANVLYATTGGSTINAAVLTQAVLDAFSVRLIINFGSAGAINNSISIGDVVVPKRVAFTGNFNWLKYRTMETRVRGQLKIGDYNTPEKGENYLEGLDVNRVDVHKPSSNSTKTAFWLLFDSDLLAIANDIEVDLAQCVDSTCLHGKPKLVTGRSASTADIYVDNYEYREHLFWEFKVSTVDTESAAILLAAKSNGVPSITIRGITNTAGKPSDDSSAYYLGSTNAVLVVRAFLEKLPIPYLAMPNF
uniref:Vegetative storage protein n=1 Tax=Bruguiera gymnorhiza TaxID=39984 RepID=B1Q4T0_BRUGY|nr:vegetative storage protein [Bruguiera gymnorhiza]